MDYPLILASASPRRKRLLQQIGLPFLPLTSHVEENRVLDQSPGNLCLLAEKKARAVLMKSDNSWILGADTIVVLGEKILGKPMDHNEARSMLYLLSGHVHRVITGFCILDPSGRLAQVKEVTTFVKMKKLTDYDIDAYIDTGEPFGKAGSYAIQGVGAFMVETISGSYTNVVGLPVCTLIKCLLITGALKRFPFMGVQST
ncbi:MAG: Maf family protein [Thermodesulfobacteriota bacterium]|nr:Maf family protein [Thermodesulfobacteriota bacterium]